jgi:hypothetical protein
LVLSIKFFTILRKPGLIFHMTNTLLI